ncbi:MAG: tetratricopeptide repeat protein [Candidatus Dependentiae bacterium]
MNKKTIITLPILAMHLSNMCIPSNTKNYDIVAVHMAHDQSGKNGSEQFNAKSEMQALKKMAESGNTTAMNELGIMFLNIREYQEAIDWFKKALEIESEQPVYNANIAHAYHSIGQLESARFHLEKAAQKGLTLALISLGNLAIEEKKYDEAIEWYQQAIEKDNKTKYKKKLAFAHKLNKNHQEAVNILKKIAQEEHDDEAMNQIGLIEYEQNNPQSAIHWFKKAIKIKNSSVYIFNLALTYQSVDKMDKAIEWYKKSAAKNCPLSLEKLGMYALDQGSYDQAIRLFKKAIKIDDENPNYYNSIARAYEQKGNDNLATEYYQKADELKKNIFSSLFLPY